MESRIVYDLLSHYIIYTDSCGYEEKQKLPWYIILPRQAKKYVKKEFHWWIP